MFKLILEIDFLSASCEITLRWMPIDRIDNKAMLV